MNNSRIKYSLDDGWLHLQRHSPGSCFSDGLWCQTSSLCWTLFNPVDEVASWTVGAVAVEPVLLTVLGLVLVVSHHVLLQENKRIIMISGESRRT